MDKKACFNACILALCFIAVSNMNNIKESYSNKILTEKDLKDRKVPTQNLFMTEIQPGIHITGLHLQNDYALIPMYCSRYLQSTITMQTKDHILKSKILSFGISAEITDVTLKPADKTLTNDLLVIKHQPVLKTMFGQNNNNIKKIDKLETLKVGTIKKDGDLLLLRFGRNGGILNYDSEGNAILQGLSLNYADLYVHQIAYESENIDHYGYAIATDKFADVITESDSGSPILQKQIVDGNEEWILIGALQGTKPYAVLKNYGHNFPIYRDSQNKICIRRNN